jgi:membrane fusion protein (multidrug efflux system)
VQKLYTFCPAKEQGHTVRAYLIAIGLLLAIFGAIAGYLALRFAAFSEMDFSPPPVTIAAGLAREEARETYLDAVGSIKALRGVQLTSETSGEITAINFDSGDTVKAGQLLLVLNDKIEQASRENEIATLELAQILFERDRKLIAQKSIPETQYDRSKADLARARAQLAETEARLKNKRLHAPFDGTVGIRMVDQGDYVSPGTVIATLQDLSELEIDFTVPDRYAPLLQPGQLIEVFVNAFPEESFAAQLVAMDARVDPETRNLLLRARLQTSKGLLPGMFASLRLNLGQTENLVTVAETAVTYSLQGNVVHVIEEAADGGLTAISRIVKVGDVEAGRTAILEGLQAGERVVTAGQNKLYRGVKVLVDESVEL